METSPLQRALSSLSEESSNDPYLGASEHNFQPILVIAICIFSLLGIIPIVVFIYSYIRREALERAREERRRQRIEAFLEEAGNTETKSSWQKAIEFISETAVEDVLGQHMNVSFWSSECAARNNDGRNECSHNECAICISQFEDGDEVVESLSKVSTYGNGNTNIVYDENHVCLHKFHKSCMMAWLMKSKEPICPCCRQIYVDESSIMEEGLTKEKEKCRERQNSDLTIVTLNASVHSHESV